MPMDITSRQAKNCRNFEPPCGKDSAARMACQIIDKLICAESVLVVVATGWAVFSIAVYNLIVPELTGNEADLFTGFIIGTAALSVVAAGFFMILIFDRAGKKSAERARLPLTRRTRRVSPPVSPAAGSPVTSRPPQLPPTGLSPLPPLQV